MLHQLSLKNTNVLTIASLIGVKYRVVEFVGGYDLMEKLVIRGGNKLFGTVRISGAKNAVLPLIAATLLGTSPSTLEEVPDLEDVRTFAEVLKHLGVIVQYNKEQHMLSVDTTSVKSCEAPYELVRKMRASFLIMGPLLARYGHSKISLPGGCAIGTPTLA